MLCPICNSKMTSSKNLYHCSDCDFLYQPSSLKPEEEKQRYDLHNNTKEDVRYVQYMENILEKIKEYIHGDVLDYGSGEGFMLEHLIGADSYDLFYAPRFPKELYDTIITIETVEHFINPVIEFEKMVSHLKPGGTLIIHTQFYKNQGTDWYYLRDETHRSFYSMKTFEVLQNTLRLSMQFTDERSIIVLKREG